jgi:hypothetical protein
MNEYDIARAWDRYADHPVLGPAVETVANVAEWANTHSDGWAYWPKPCRACAKLIELIEGDGTYRAIQEAHLRATVAAYRRALVPIKTFRTRVGADFRIVDPRPVQGHPTAAPESGFIAG